MQLDVNPISFYVLMLVILAMGLTYLTWGYLSGEPFRILVAMYHFVIVLALFYLVHPRNRHMVFKLEI